MDKSNRALTIKEVAEFLNISNQMVYNLIKTRELQAFKIGSALRILYSDLLEYIGKQKKLFEAKTADFKPDFKNEDPALFVVHKLNLQEGDFALKDISFSFPRGRILSLLGTSGSGKTLLLRAIAGLNSISGGCIYLGEKRLDTLDIQAREIGFIFQSHTFFPHKDKSALFVKGKKQLPELQEENWEQVIRELVHNQPNLEKSIKRLPGGIRQLAAFAREKIYPVELLLLDEPLNQLDPETYQLVTALIRQTIAGTGKTVIIACSNARDVLALSDYTAIINQGRIIQFGDSAAVYNQPASVPAAELFSCLGVNHLTVEVQANRILPWQIPTAQLADGIYRMLFRTEEIKPVSRGIKVHTEQERFYDSRQKIVTAVTAEGVTLTLLVPENITGDFCFLPVNPLLFAQAEIPPGP